MALEESGTFQSRMGALQLELGSIFSLLKSPQIAEIRHCKDVPD